MKYLICFIILTSSLFACKKESDHETVCLSGTIEWNGDFAVDGTGWNFYPAGENQRPYILKDLSASFQQDGLAVDICIYDTGEKVICECIGEPHYYGIEKINKR